MIFKSRAVLFVTVTLAIAVLAACQSAPKPKIESIYNKAADFSVYRTFSLTREPEMLLYDDAKPYIAVFNTAIISAMEDKGYRHIEEGGDLFVNYRAEVDNQLESFNNAIPITPNRMGYYSSWASLYGPLPQEREGGSTRITYTGALNIDVVDAKHKQAIWQGVYQQKITSDRRDDREALIKKAAEDVLATLPHANK
ncbi:DUF4136 domain-containing protein [Gilvimarinus sp. SDUM040013]|uniref:DUF4136 domain-containing protein n=1 Tax=Gilvimarinus gilvus TaxID=3058038 RepID=A0ABU4RZX8_9GAMM|nr:DUF4136 domain-containing protein [Gilvimarinus sp. SDUM040013]MDO3384732.1 DUF4136 domain-containing protein [Gilvimarinus sp. SDUM040013]MDX6850450.1 DUF4136 domain-containing protein [Gilvimarinus sp. SDUM040013]